MFHQSLVLHTLETLNEKSLFIIALLIKLFNNSICKLTFLAKIASGWISIRN